MSVKARDDVTLASVADVANVRRYYLLQSSTLAAPSAPTVNPAPSPWVTAEPSYDGAATNSLYTLDLTVFSDGTFDYSTVSKSSSYEAAKNAWNKAASATTIANQALAAVPPFMQQTTPSATVVGQLWYPLDSTGRIIGMKRATKTGTGGWETLLAMAGQILVPGTVGTTEIGPDGVLAANIKASNELWAKLASFAEVTTDMLLAGNATITNSMLVDKLAGKSIYGAYMEGGELLIQGTDEAATPTTGTYTTFETASDINVWAVSLSSSGVSRDSSGKSGYCVKGVNTASSTSGTYTIQSALNTKYLNTLSAWNLSSCPYDGITTVSAWVKSSVADTLSVAWFDFQNANGDAVAISKTVDVVANTWTLVQLVGPTGYRPTLTNNPLLPTFMVLGQKVASTQGAMRSLWVDQITWSNRADTSSAVHVYRDSRGSPCVEVIDYQGTVRAKLAAPSSSAAGLTFYADDGEYVFSADGLRSGNQSVPWADVISSSNYVDLSSQCTLGTDANYKMTRINLYKIGKLYILSGAMSGTSVSMTGWQLIDIGTIPASAKPLVNGTSNPCSAYPSGFRQLLQKGSNKIQFQCLAAGAAPGSWDVQLMWVNP